MPVLSLFLFYWYFHWSLQSLSLITLYSCKSWNLLSHGNLFYLIVLLNLLYYPHYSFSRYRNFLKKNLSLNYHPIIAFLSFPNVTLSQKKCTCIWVHFLKYAFKKNISGDSQTFQSRIPRIRTLGSHGSYVSSHYCINVHMDLSICMLYTSFLRDSTCCHKN